MVSLFIFILLLRSLRRNDCRKERGYLIHLWGFKSMAQAYWWVGWGSYMDDRIMLGDPPKLSEHILTDLIKMVHYFP